MAVIDERRVELRDTAAGWAADDITPLNGELALELDVSAGGPDIRMKIGDGALAFSALNYVSRRTLVELNVDISNYVTANGTDLSAGVADAGKIVLLDTAGLIDSSMLPTLGTIAWNFLGRADFTAAIPPAPGGTYSTGDVYFNTADGQTDPTWGWRDETVNTAQPGVFEGDMAFYDLEKGGPGVAGWRLIGGEIRHLYLLERSSSGDAPVGGTFHTGGSVQVRLS